MGIIDRTLERGLPDWSNIRAAQSIVRMADMGELAARLGSIVTFDRRGDVVLLDDFEDGVDRWAVTAASPSLATATPTLAYRRSGAIGVDLYNGIGSGDWVQLASGLGYRRTSALGFEASVVTAGTGKVTLGLSDFDGANERRWQIMFYFGTAILYYLDDAGAEAQLASNVSWYSQLYQWSTLKLVANPVTGDYVRLIFNNLEYDLSAYAGYQVASATSPNLTVSLRHTNILDVPAHLYADDAIVTMNEP